MDTTEYLGVFIDESNEHLEVLYNQLLALEKNPNEKKIIEEIFRAAHTLKGMSATMGFSDLANLTHKLENVFDAIKYEKVTVNVEMMDILFAAVDHLNEMVEDISSGGDGTRDVSQAVEQLQAIESGNSVSAVQMKEADSTTQQQEATQLQHVQGLDEFELTILSESSDRGYSNYEINVTLREDCLLKGARVFMVFEVLEKLGEIVKSEPSVNELEEEQFDTSFTVIFISEHSKEKISTNIEKVSEIEQVEVHTFSASTYKADQQSNDKARDEQQTQETKSNKDKKQQNSAKTSANKTIRVNIDRLDVLMNLFEELVVDRGRLEQISLDLNHGDLQETVEHMSRVSSDLQSIILTMRMVPIEQVFNRFPRMIRQLARDLNKNVEIEIIGAETELDRTVIDEIGDPLVHLIRNAIDHGIESPDERLKKGKSEHGTIKLEAYHSGNHVFIEIEDDGAGINKEKVLKKAIANGVVNDSQSELLSDQQIFELIMASGFSTADTVSDISGRGVGLDVVKNTIESLGGRISIDAKKDQGSIFSIQLPLTLSIISVLLIELQNEKYAIPLSSIIETAIIHRDDIMHAHNTKVIDFRGKVVPLAFLNDIFTVPADDNVIDNEYISVVIVKKGNKMTGLVVDAFIGQQEVVLKSLGSYLSNTFAISGATILGDGEVALIVDSNALVI
ncbi:chemotaxis protein CheA [Virgibacillus sp. AGTR]|uniref:Chemotaxis protein CheA n=1 Tax=Virgibacillus salarius TaxID=447199 RepID=A0A941DV74_9BACI|nr:MULTISPECIES: chemotaxis protein CheA [Bacillaceae]NAZ07568.1 chemotaxis protein CheA [Agaribacter marinus]MBR7794848.1 chemotaxis protein CheA [Virgibacillus salarius]MCC2249261.1 chemotaxis protein CheA [Virgibacillus sp. AGTR]MDY7043913.1 chemotaxis protein CheA [Virgibacillus sp. M23]QRZ17297.1 chemotaxis protein CheA [Virgibacillus sp. AGTR]